MRFGVIDLLFAYILILDFIILRRLLLRGLFLLPSVHFVNFHVAHLVEVCLEALAAMRANEPLNALVKQHVLLEVGALGESQAAVGVRALVGRLPRVRAQVVEENVSLVEGLRT